jgi:hypothetical protein
VHAFIHPALYFLSCILVYVLWYISPQTIQTPALVTARPTLCGMFLVDPTLLPMRRMHLHIHPASSPPALLHRYRAPTLPLQINCSVNAPSRRISLVYAP